MKANANMMQRLMWKDAMTIKPLLIAIVIGTIALNFMMLIFAASYPSEHDGINGFISLWILMPNLVALGAPALLVGSEEESGTLGWLRTLPVRWQQVVDSKFIVSLAAVAVTWAIASLLLLVGQSVFSFRSTALSDDLLSLTGVSQLAFFSVLLLTSGFITAYLLRSPVTALIVLVPFIYVANTLAIEIGRWILSGYWRFGGSIENAGYVRSFTLVTSAVLTLVLLWFGQRYLARRRLTSPQGISFRLPSSPTNEAYRPPARVGMERPSQFVTLLWQQARQLGWAGVMLVVVIAASLLLYRFTDHSVSRFATSLEVLGAFAPSFVALGASWLGSLAFYGDSVLRRCDFFADRGISPTKIWLTRLLLPSSLCGALVAFQLALTVSASASNVRIEGAVMAVMIIMMFVFGQLVAQWMPRATLTFLAAPTYAMVSCAGLFFLFSFYPGYFPTILLMVPVLLFATWRMMGRWLQGRINAGFHSRVVAYTLLAMLLPCLAVFGNRYWTTPAEMTQWRAQMLAADVGPLVSGSAHEVSPDAAAWSGSGMDLDLKTIGGSMKKELAGDGMIAAHVSRSDIDEVLDAVRGDNEIRYDAIAVLLKWATTIREEAALGMQDLFTLENYAEPNEARAVGALGLMKHHADARWAELVDKIPSEELRRQSRKVALTTEWRNYQRTPWEQEYTPGDITYYKAFMHQGMALGVENLSLERRRADRYVDEATRFTLAQLDGPLQVLDSPQYEQQEELWHQAMGPRYLHHHERRTFGGYLWTSGYQGEINQLRAHRNDVVGAEESNKNSRGN